MANFDKIIEVQNDLNAYFQIQQYQIVKEFKFDQIGFKPSMINQSSQAVNPKHMALTDTWYLQKKSLFSLKAEWINCRLRLTPPSASASQVLDKSYNEL